jgi:predicted nucleic acid-binding protein
VTTYVDSSALIKRYVDEPDSELAVALCASDDVLVTSWITLVEVRRNLSRLLTGKPLAAARAQFLADIDAIALVSLDETTCTLAAGIAEDLGVRSLDSLHLASAQRLLIAALPFVTFDRRQGHAARALGFTVLGS